MKKLLTALTLHALLIVPLFAADAPQPSAKEVKARELLVLLRTGDTAMQAIDGMMVSMKDAMPQVPAEYWDSFKKQIKPDEFIELLVPIYAANLEESDLDGLITFFKSPAGQSYVAKQSAIMQQSMEVGGKWGEEVAERAIRALNEKKD